MVTANAHQYLCAKIVDVTDNAYDTATIAASAQATNNAAVQKNLNVALKDVIKTAKQLAGLKESAMQIRNANAYQDVSQHNVITAVEAMAMIKVNV